MEVVRIVMLGMTGVLLGLFLKGTRPEYSVYLSLAAGILIFFYMIDKLSYLFSSVMKIQDYLPLDIKYLTTAFAFCVKMRFHILVISVGTSSKLWNSPYYSFFFKR